MASFSEKVQFTGEEYKDGTKVPRRLYRCKATARKPDEPGRTHPCKRVTDHDETGHICICGFAWGGEEHEH